MSNFKLLKKTKMPKFSVFFFGNFKLLKTTHQAHLYPQLLLATRLKPQQNTVFERHLLLFHKTKKQKKTSFRLEVLFVVIIFFEILLVEVCHV